MKAEAWLSDWNTAGTEFLRCSRNDNNLALAVLIGREAAINALLFHIGRFPQRSFWPAWRQWNLRE
jgi:hypothetical protein